MDETKLEDLVQDIAEIKASIKKNDPMLRALMSARGWGYLSLFGALAATFFSLPAHILTVKYGSFGVIPALWKAALWAVVAIFLVGGGVWKVLFLTKTASQIAPGLGWGDILESLYRGSQKHTHIPSFIGIGVAVAFAIYIGHPWYILPAFAILFTFYSNGLGIASGIKGYFSMGWWCFLTGSAGLFSVEKAPFLWLFIIAGGMLYTFAGAMFLLDRNRRETP